MLPSLSSQCSPFAVCGEIEPGQAIDGRTVKRIKIMSCLLQTLHFGAIQTPKTPLGLFDSSFLSHLLLLLLLLLFPLLLVATKTETEEAPVLYNLELSLRE